MQRIRKGDLVIVLSGANKGARGEVLRVLANNYVIVDGVNMRTKHVKPNPNKQQKGGIEERPGPIHLSNIALFDEQTGKGQKVGFKFLQDGRKVRYFKQSNEVIDQ